MNCTIIVWTALTVICYIYKRRKRMKILLSDEVKLVIDRFSEHGYTAYAVGGCVRDLLLSLNPKDWDVASPASPDETKEIFKDFKVLDTGIKHGTVTVIINSMPIEVTAFRTEGAYSDRRHPDFVEFTKDIESDLKRRDFTVNALAYNPIRGIVDISGGLDDLKNKVIRTVGNPKERFDEDPLRILRALRFASALGFTIEEETEKAVHKYHPLLGEIAAERIYAELKALFSGQRIEYVLSGFKDVVAFLFPEIKESLYSGYEALFGEVSLKSEEVFKAISLLRGDFYLRAALLFSSGKEADAEMILNRLRSDKATSGKVQKLVKALKLPLPSTKADMKRFINAFGFDAAEDYLIAAEKVGCAIESKALPNLSSAKSFFETIRKNKEAVTIHDLDIKGTDIQNLGFKGAEVGKALEILLDAVFEEECENTKVDLIRFIKNRSEDIKHK